MQLTIQKAISWFKREYKYYELKDVRNIHKNFVTVDKIRKKEKEKVSKITWELWTLKNMALDS